MGASKLPIGRFSFHVDTTDDLNLIKQTVNHFHKLPLLYMYISVCMCVNYVMKDDKIGGARS